MKGIYIDDDAKVIDEHYAVVFAPRRSRNRFPENNVEIVNSEAMAIEKSNPDQKYYAAKVVGPSRSSEGLRLYYLSCWLDE